MAIVATVTTFHLHPTSEVYRPQRTLSKPHTKGLQSAIVTGPAGQEIWTDKYGRVKVQFGWDRYGKNDENSPPDPASATRGRGKDLGMIQIPRHRPGSAGGFKRRPRFTDYRGAHLQPGHDAAVGATGHGVSKRNISDLL